MKFLGYSTWSSKMGFIKIRVEFWTLRNLVFAKHIPIEAIKCRYKGTIFPEHTEAIIQGKILCLRGVAKYCDIVNHTTRSNLLHIGIFHLCTRIKHSNFSPNFFCTIMIISILYSISQRDATHWSHLTPLLNKHLPHTIFRANMQLDPSEEDMFLPPLTSGLVNPSPNYPSPIST